MQEWKALEKKKYKDLSARSPVTYEVDFCSVFFRLTYPCIQVHG